MGFANAKPNALARGCTWHERRREPARIGLRSGPCACRSCFVRRVLSGRSGLDWSESCSTQAARRNRRALEAGRLALVRGDFAKLPFNDEIADAVLAVNVVYFMQQLLSAA